MSIWRWADWLPETPAAVRITLGEGSTPLLRSRRIGPQFGLPNLYFKLDSVNPTGSYKDRFAAAAISDMVAHGKQRCIATSSGNTGSALAAYCAVAGISCEIAIIETAPQAKLQQMMAYGANIYRVRGFGIDSAITAQIFEHLNQQGQQPDAEIQISAFAYSPAGMAGVQTISYELAEQTAEIDHVFCPAGGGGLTLAVARGFGVLVREKQISNSPRIECVQPEGNDTIATPLREGAPQAHAVECTSAIGGLQVASVIDGNEVVRECRATGGSGHVVTDEEVWQTQALMARHEGIFCEPAGAVALAGALRALRKNRIRSDAHVVCLVTGTGFKDQSAVERMLADVTCPMVEPDSLQ
jgi:threonine synthase